MAITTAARYSDEEIRSLVHDGIVDPQVEEDLTALQSEARKGLQALTAFPTISQLDRADNVEDYAVLLAAQMAEDAGALGHGADVFAWRLSGGAADDDDLLPGPWWSEEDAALVAELRRQAAWCEARRAEAGALAADARRLRDKRLRAASGVSMENKDGGEALRAATGEFLEHVAREMDGGDVSYADGPRADAMDAAARAGQGLGARFVAVLRAGLPERFRRHALDCCGARDEVFKEALGRRAAEMEEMCADPEKLVERMLGSSVYRVWRAVNKHARPQSSSIAAANATPTPAAKPTM